MMTRLDLAHLRLHNQRLVDTRCRMPEDVVSWLGAVQAQDYGGAKWGIPQRTTGASNAELDQVSQG